VSLNPTVYFEIPLKFHELTLLLHAIIMQGCSHQKSEGLYFAAEIDFVKHLIGCY